MLKPLILYQLMSDVFWRVFGRNPFFTFFFFYIILNQDYSKIPWLIASFVVWAFCKNLSENYNSYLSIRRLVKELSLGGNNYQSTTLPENLRNLYSLNAPRKILFSQKKDTDIDAKLEVVVSNSFMPPMAFPNHTEKSYIIIPNVSYLRENISPKQKIIILHELCHCIDYTMHYEGLGKTYTLIYSLFLVFISFASIDLYLKIPLVIYFMFFIFIKHYLHFQTFEGMVDIRALSLLEESEIESTSRFLYSYHNIKLNSLKKKKANFSKRFSIAMRRSTLKMVLRTINNSKNNPDLIRKMLNNTKSVNKNNYLSVLIKSVSENDVFTFWLFPSQTIVFYILITKNSGFSDLYYHLFISFFIILLIIFYILYTKRIKISDVARSIYKDLEIY